MTAYKKNIGFQIKTKTGRIGVIIGVRKHSYMVDFGGGAEQEHIWSWDVADIWRILDRPTLCTGKQ